jgi:hypothetical protein
MMSRNQKKKREYAQNQLEMDHDLSVGPLKKFRFGEELKEKHLSQLLNTEILRLDNLQDQLSAKITFANVRNETKDMEMQMLVNRFTKE